MKTELDNNEKLSTEQEAPPIANVMLGAVNQCKKLTTVAVIMKHNQLISIGTNSIDYGISECARKDMPTGVGYELCKSICKQKYHAEVDACIKAGENAKGATLYLIGHTYCCDNCKKVMDEHGILNVIVCP
jgi:deoxycytidylate deaminase